MGNCKSSAAAAGVVVAGQNGNGLAAYDTLKHADGKGADASTVVTSDASTVTTDRKPLLQIQTDGNVEVPNGGLALSPTAELSEATSKDSQDASSQNNSSENQIVAEEGKRSPLTTVIVTTTTTILTTTRTSHRRHRANPPARRTPTATSS